MTYLLALLAGALTTLNPCVLPMLPLVAAGGIADSRGPWLLTGGLVTSFTLVGLAVAASGALLGLQADLVRQVAAIGLILSGLAMAYRPARSAFARLLGPIAARATSMSAGLSGERSGGRFGVGLLLGAIWSPCTGPTLAAATALAAQRQSLGEAAIVMLLFSMGMAAVFLTAASLLRLLSPARRQSLAAKAGRGRNLFGWSLAAVGVLVLSGTDRIMEVWLVRAMPSWMLALTTRF